MIGYNEWNVIIRRRNYYIRLLIDNTIKLPKEPCLSQFKRKLITHRPPPFHCDYKPDISNGSTSNNNKKKSDSLNKSCINDFRKRFGYSSRPERLSCNSSVKLSYSCSNHKNRASTNSLVNVSSVECI